MSKTVSNNIPSTQPNTKLEQPSTDNAEQVLAQQLIDQLLETITLKKTAHDTFEAPSHDYVGQRIFGGQVLAQAIMAAAQTLEDDKPCHSLHGYFLRGGDIDQPVVYRVRRLRDGRSLSAREVTAMQYKENKDGEQVEQVIFSMIASFSPMEGGLDYQGHAGVSATRRLADRARA